MNTNQDNFGIADWHVGMKFWVSVDCHNRCFFFVICLFYFATDTITILKEHELLISVYSQYTTYQKETKKKLQFTKHYSE